MTCFIYAIYDLKALHLFQPFIACSDTDAMNIYIRSVEPDSSLWDHGETFALYRLGTIEYGEKGDYKVDCCYDFIDTFDHILFPMKTRYKAYCDLYFNGDRLADAEGGDDETCEENK